MKKIVVLLFIGLFLIITVSSSSFTLVKISTINSNYELSYNLKNKIENETKGMDEIRIARYSVKLTASILNFAEKNDLKNSRANCVGYAMLCRAVCEYAYRINGFDTKVFHVRGYVESSYGFNICKLLKNIVPKNYENFVKDHDFIEINSINNNKIYYLDPTSYDIIGLDNFTAVNKN